MIGLPLQGSLRIRLSVYAGICYIYEKDVKKELIQVGFAFITAPKVIIQRKPLLYQVVVA